MTNAAITPAAEAALESGEGPWWDLLQVRQEELYSKHPELMFGAA